jgi:ribose/xylose/arabinose/galactoside ABC-type transport system permease subunit
VTRLPEALRRDLLPFSVFAVAAASLALLPQISNATITHFNAYNVLQTFADYGLLALAIGLTMIAAEYDISTASMYGLAGMVAVLTGADAPAYGILAALAVGLVGGLAHGAIVTRLRLAAVPVTLGGFIIYLGITYVISHGNDVTYDRITVGLRLDEPVASIFSIRSLITIAGFLLAAAIFQLTRLGPEIRAVGGDRRASRIAGVRVDRLMVGIFAVSGLCAAAAGSLHSYSLSSAQPDLGFNPLIFATIAALVGGVRLSGGRGSPLGIAAGVLSLAILQEILAAVAAPQYTGNLVTGGLLLLVTIFAAPVMTDWWARRTSAAGEVSTSPPRAP